MTAVWRAFPNAAFTGVRTTAPAAPLERPKSSLRQKNFVSALSNYGSIPTIQTASSDQPSPLVTGLDAVQDGRRQ